MTETNDSDYEVVLWLFKGDRKEAMRALAAELRKGNPSHLLLWLLAQQVDPDIESPNGTKLILKRPRAGRPLKVSDGKLGKFLELHIDIFKEGFEMVIAAAMERFGVNRTTCTNALKEIRRVRRRDPIGADWVWADSLKLRDLGHPDYQPLFESTK